jgi:hypothetical protein
MFDDVEKALAIYALAPVAARGFGFTLSRTGPDRFGLSM